MCCVWTRYGLCMSGYGMGCVCVVMVWVVLVWLKHGLFMCGYGMGCVGLVNGLCMCG